MDARVLTVQQQRSGIAQYILGLFQGYRANPLDIALRPTSFTSVGIQELGQEPYVMPLRRPLPWLSVTVPLSLRSSSTNVFHGPAFAVPGHLKIPTVATIHDLTYLRMPTAVTDDTVRYLSRVVPHALKTAAGIIVPSQEVKEDLIKYYPMLASHQRIRVIPEGSDRLCKVTAPSPLPFPYVAHVGTVEPRKNLPNLVKAWDAVKAELKVPHRLALIGNRGWKTEQFLASLGKRADIVVTGYIDDGQLAVYLANASCVIQSSYYEGFGLPVVEALFQGTQAVSTPTGIARDLSHPNLIVTEGFSSDDLAEGLRTALSLSHEPPIESGSRPLMSWQEVYEAHARLYHEVAP